MYLLRDGLGKKAHYPDSYFREFSSGNFTEGVTVKHLSYEELEDLCCHYMKLSSQLLSERREQS